MINKKILEIRQKLDKLDDKLLDLIRLRTELVKKILSNKRYKKDIIDKKRIKIILKNISKKSKKKGVDKIVAKKIWNGMIRAFIDYEYRNFKKKN